MQFALYTLWLKSQSGEKELLFIQNQVKVVLKLNSHILQTFHYSKYIEQPYYKNDYNNCIQNIFNGALHGNVTVNQPEYNTGNNNDDKNC